MEEKNITIDELAIMIAKGFEETSKKAEVDFQFKEVNTRLDRIEKILLVDHRMRIEKLEEEVKYLKGLLAVN